MDGITAKRILIALAKKLSFDSIRRANREHQFTLKFVKKGQRGSCPILIRPIGSTSYVDYSVVSCKSGQWLQILNALVGHEITPNCSNGKSIDIYSVEQLAIDLELEGYLKNA